MLITVICHQGVGQTYFNKWAINQEKTRKQGRVLNIEDPFAGKISERVQF